MCFRPATANANTVSCPMCGHENPISATQCEECGFAVSTPGHAPAAPGAPKAPGAPGVPKAPGAPKAPAAPKAPQA